MGNDNHTIGEVSELLANAWTPSFNLEDQLRYIAYPSIYGDAEPLSVLLRVLFELDFGYEGDTFYHKCYPGSWRGWHDVHKPFAVALVS